MKVYRQTADASMYYRETTAADSARINSSAFPISFPRVVEDPVVSPNVEVVKTSEHGSRNDVPEPASA